MKLRRRGLTAKPTWAGHHVVIWSGTDAQGSGVAAGAYFYRIIAGDLIKSKKMLLLK